MSDDALIEEIELVLRRARARRREARADTRYRDTLLRVEGYLAAHPDASANVVWKEVGGRRQDVLQAVREVRSWFPTAGNHLDGERPR